MRFKNLSDVHTRRNAEGIQNDFHRRAVRQIRHVFFRNDSGDDALVAVAAGHFVADRKFSLHGDVALHQLDDAGRKLVALAELFLALLGDFAEHVDLARGHLLDLIDFLDQQRVLIGEAQPLEVARGDFFDDVARELGALGDQALVGLFVVQVGGERLAFEQHGKALEALVREDADFIRQVLFELENLRGLDGLVAFVFFSALAAEDFHVHDGALDARRAVEGSVAHIAGLFTEDRAEQFFFRRERGFALRSDLADQDVSRTHGSANADYAAFIEVAKKHFADVGNIARDFLGAEFRVPRLDFVFLDVNGGVVVVLDQLFADQDGVLEVVPAPRHERDQNVAAEREFAAIGARAVGQDLPLPDAVAHAHERLLVDAGVLVGTLELDELVDVRAHFAREHARVVGFDANDDPLGIDLVDNSVAAADDHRSRIARGDAFHAGADQRSFPANQWYGLALHVRTHKGAVRVVVFQERNKARRDRHQLFRRDVDVINLFARFQDEVSGLAAVDEFGGDAPALVERHIGLRDHVAVLFPRRKIETVRIVRDFAALQFLVHGFHFVPLDNFAGLEFAFARVDDHHVVDHAPGLHLAVGRLDKAELVDPSVAGQRADQTDVRAFRRFDRADAAVVRWVNVAHLEPGAFAREAARPKGRETPLVGDFGERIGLVHELRELGTAEELANRRHDRLGVHKVVRHGGGHFLVHRHLFLNRALHADEADAELVLEEFADRTHAAVAEVIDVVQRADVLAQLHQVADGRDEVGGVQRARVERRFQAELDVEFQAAHAAEIVLARVEEHPVEQSRGRFERWRIAGAQFSVDFDQS